MVLVTPSGHVESNFYTIMYFPSSGCCGIHLCPDSLLLSKSPAPVDQKFSFPRLMFQLHIKLSVELDSGLFIVVLAHSAPNAYRELLPKFWSHRYRKTGCSRIRRNRKSLYLKILSTRFLWETASFSFGTKKPWLHMGLNYFHHYPLSAVEVGIIIIMNGPSLALWS